MMQLLIMDVICLSCYDTLLITWEFSPLNTVFCSERVPYVGSKPPCTGADHQYWSLKAVARPASSFFSFLLLFPPHFHSFNLKIGNFGKSAHIRVQKCDFDAKARDHFFIPSKNGRRDICGLLKALSQHFVTLL